MVKSKSRKKTTSFSSYSSIMLAYYFLNKEYSIHVHVKVIYLKEHNAQSVIDTTSGEYTLVY